MRSVFVTLLLLVGLEAANAADVAKLFDAKCTIIENSLRAHRSYAPTNPCACPYNKQSNATPCQRKSAWNRKGGPKPFCYVDDIPNQAAIDFVRTGLMPEPQFSSIDETKTPNRDQCPVFIKQASQ